MNFRVGASSAAAATELVVVDLLPQHDVEPDEQFAGEGDLRLGATLVLGTRTLPILTSVSIDGINYIGRNGVDVGTAGSWDARRR